jgi:hypothetical protein
VDKEELINRSRFAAFESLISNQVELNIVKEVFSLGSCTKEITIERILRGGKLAKEEEYKEYD